MFSLLTYVQNGDTCLYYYSTLYMYDRLQPTDVISVLAVILLIISTHYSLFVPPTHQSISGYI